MSVRALIVDDERLARVSLKKLLARHADVEIAGEADSVDSAARAITALDPDLVFLDISLPDGSGFDLFERLPIRARTVFVTAHDEHALRAFRVNALDYLLKPVEPAELARAIDRLDASRPEPGGRLSDGDVVCLAEAGGTKFVRLADIVHIRAADEYTEVSLVSGKSILASTSLRRWQERLPASSFARVHRSAIVNLAHVSEIAGDRGLVVILRDGRGHLPVSRRLGRLLRRRLRSARRP